MKSVERIILTINFAKPDRLPVVPQIFGHAAKLLNTPLREYCLDGETLAKCQLYALSQYQYDAVFAVAGALVETEAMGSKLEYRDSQYPFVHSYVLRSVKDLPGIAMPNPSKDGRMPEILKSLSLMRRELGDATLVVGLVLGPTTLAVQLLGIERALYSAADDPDDFENLLDFCTSVQKVYGRAQLDAGAHLVMIFDPCVSTEIVPPQFFREMELPRITEMFSCFAENGASASWLHVAGQNEKILPHYSSAGVNIANFDYCVDPSAVQALLPRMCVNGNLRSLAFVEQDPETVAESAGELIKAFATRGGFILSSGCEIPYEARPDNIKAFVEAATGGEKGCLTSR